MGGGGGGGVFSNIATASRCLDQLFPWVQLFREEVKGGGGATGFEPV